MQQIKQQQVQYNNNKCNNNGFKLDMNFAMKGGRNIRISIYYWEHQDGFGTVVSSFFYLQVL